MSLNIHILNGLTINTRWPLRWRTGQVCLLVETRRGLILVDTGLGQDDYLHPAPITRLFRVFTRMPFDPEQAIVRQIHRLGFIPQDVRHIVLTHLHFDHCGGLADFPWARVHVHANEYEDIHKFKFRRWADGGYNRRVLSHQPDLVLYGSTDSTWYDFDAIHLPFKREMYLVPLFGHTSGHCGVTVKHDSGWYFLVGDAVSFTEEVPLWLLRFVVGPHHRCLRAFEDAHPEVHMLTGHMPLEYFHLLEGKQRVPRSKRSA
jgi:glyoxylase-like metal-dependent hydrolase (beta-lactamase superfamily II)